LRGLRDELETGSMTAAKCLRVTESRAIAIDHNVSPVRPSADDEQSRAAAWARE